MNSPDSPTELNYRFSGHETFPCRYAWLPKAVRGLREDPALFSNEDDAMVRLGVGKNMVRAIRFWADAAGVIQNEKSKAQNGNDPETAPSEPMLLDKAKREYSTGKRTGNSAGDWVVSDFGNAIFGRNGHDQFLGQAPRQ